MDGDGVVVDEEMSRNGCEWVRVFETFNCKV
jgi:hypothetical protein